MEWKTARNLHLLKCYIINWNLKKNLYNKTKINQPYLLFFLLYISIWSINLTECDIKQQNKNQASCCCCKSSCAMDKPQDNVWELANLAAFLVFVTHFYPSFICCYIFRVVYLNKLPVRLTETSVSWDPITGESNVFNNSSHFVKIGIFTECRTITSSSIS